MAEGGVEQLKVSDFLEWHSLWFECYHGGGSAAISAALCVVLLVDI